METSSGAGSGGAPSTAPAAILDAGLSYFSVRVLVLSQESHDEPRRERLRALAGRGIDIVLATPGGTAGSDGGIRLAPVPVKGSPDEPLELRWHGPTLRRLLTETRPDLVHLEAEPDTQLAVTAATLCRKLAIPYVVFSWRSLPRTGGFFSRRRAGRVLRGAAGVVGGNRIAMDLLHDAAPEAIAAAIPPAGLTLPPVRPATTRETLTIGFAGRLVPDRAPDVFVAALGRTYGRWQAIIAGTGPEQEALEAEIQRMGLAARIRWLGGLRAETLEALWGEIDCLVVTGRDTPTWTDHHAPLLLEAMGRGIPAIVTRTGALPELAGPDGIVADDADGIAAALQPWVAEPARCRAAGVAARRWILDRHLTSVVAERTLEFWHAVVEHARAPAAA